MNCKQANSVDMVEFLSSCGYNASYVRNVDYWYHSPLHEESTPSFKVNATKNTWYDFGIGKGGTLIDFVCILKQVDVGHALEIIAGRNEHTPIIISSRNNDNNSPDSCLIIQNENSIITNSRLRQYLNDRHIPPIVYRHYCKEVKYCIEGNHFTAIGFKNNMGGYELRSPNFKGSSSPKFVTWLNNGSKMIHVFEGFFDFLSWQSILCKQDTRSDEIKSNFLILNSLSFFTRSILLMEKHESINLWFDNDKAGDECTKQLQQRGGKVTDKRILYTGYKDLNEWCVKQTDSLKLSKGLRL